MRTALIGANPTPTITGREQQLGIVNYFLGNDASKWHTNVSTFARVEYDNVYPGIDLVWYGNSQQLEYDFVVSPGADPSAIRLNVSGAERMEIDATGDLVVTAGGQELRQHKPFVYQELNGTRQEVASRFVLDEASRGRKSPVVRFAVGAYDAGRPLVIDPVLSYSTYLGGSSEDVGSGIAVDPATGDALVTGSTTSINFPTSNPFQPTFGGARDVFVTRLNAAGSALVFSTYLGGSSLDEGLALAVDPATGDALVTGRTLSTDFPTANPLQPAHGGGGYDAFVSRIGSSPVAYYYLYPDSGPVTAGEPFDLYVFALDAGFNIIPDYTGEIVFWSTDPKATTPEYYRFQRWQQGVAYFPGGVTFRTTGTQELYVFDLATFEVYGYAAYGVR